MKKSVNMIILAALAAVSLCSCDLNSQKYPPKVYNEGIHITPIPVELVQNEGQFKLSKKTTFASSDTSGNKIAAYFASKIKKSTGYKLKIQNKKPSSNFIHLQIMTDIPVNDEGYLLDVTPKGIEIQAKSPQGLFYGMQTVMQLLPAEIECDTLVKEIEWSLPAVSIQDEPRFGYRGMHLDVCRHFRDVDFIKKQLDVLAMFKINTFHWHLTDDQGWRIEIKKYPKLTEIGAARIEGERNVYGPFFYTQEQIKEVVAYAKERFIEVIPEIELPGHAVAAIAAYPELSCTGDTIPVRNFWGVANDVFCAGNEQTFQFLEDVFTEIIPLFESDYIHIGGDECPKIRWGNCPKCQERIKSLELTKDGEHSAEEKLQSYFVQRMEKFLLKHNKKMIGWDEILEGGLAPSATVMSWRGENGGIAAANMGHDVIMTPGAWMYLDKYQGDAKLLPVTIGGYLPLEKVYKYEPVPDKIDESKRHHILGAQSNVWAEYKYTDNDTELDIYPRIIALAELNWTPKEKKNYPDFLRRIENQRVRLDMHHINYYIPLPEQQGGASSCDFVAFTDTLTLEFKTTEPVKMIYTTDGSEPDSTTASIYSLPLTFTESATLKIRSVLLSEKMGPVRHITIEKQSHAPATNRPPGTRPGLKAEYFEGYALHLADLEGKTPDRTEYVATPQNTRYRISGYVEPKESDFCSTMLTGYIHIPEDGVYYFKTDYEFWINGELLISNEKDNHGTARRFSRSDKSIALSKGYHPIKLIRLGAVFGGWPTQWDAMTLSVRKSDRSAFTAMGAEYFK